MKYTVRIYSETTDLTQRSFASRAEANRWAQETLTLLNKKLPVYSARFIK